MYEITNGVEYTKIRNYEKYNRTYVKKSSYRNIENH